MLAHINSRQLLTQLTDIKEEPGCSSTKQNPSVLPLGEVTAEIGPTGLGGDTISALVVHKSDPLDFIGVSLALTLHVSADVFIGLDQIVGNIKSKARGLRDSQTIVQGEQRRDSSKSNDDSPHFVDRKLADAGAVANVLGAFQRFPEAGSNKQSNDSRCKLAEALHGKHRSHHRTTPFGGSKSVYFVSKKAHE
jgi:hypothetical protein